jgi:formylglycine-generating enzyme required for sulfatase activity
MTDVKKCPEGMAYIQEGEFKMGSTKGNHDAQPVHDVYVSGFCMDKHEVTNAEYSSYSESPSPSGFDCPIQPVVNVDWYEADSFCKAQGKRLPTEAEWEKAARGPEGYEFGSSTGTLIRLSAGETGYDGHYSSTHTVHVCSYPENGYGLCDMMGNVFEWVSDWYDADAYSTMESRDPQGPSDGVYKVQRGGGWNVGNCGLGFLRATTRVAVHPADHEGASSGFRCVDDPLDTEKGD